MNKIRLCVLAVLCGFLILSSSAISFAQIAIPKLTNRIVDLTNSLDSVQIADIESDLARLENEKGSQIFVLILPSTAPEDIAQFGIRLAEEWQAGRKKIDDGVILIVAKDDRALRIEVGKGLEGAIPDAVSKRIIEEQILPQFRNGNFYDGIKLGVQSLIALIKGEELPLPLEAAGMQFPEEMGPLFIGSVAVASVLTSFGLKAALSGGLVGSALSIYGIIASLPWWLAIIFGIGVFILTLGSGSGSGYSRRRGYGGGSWSSGSGSSGGFSGGGGGSFSGGGASGRW